MPVYSDNLPAMCFCPAASSEAPAARALAYSLKVNFSTSARVASRFLSNRGESRLWYHAVAAKLGR